MQLNPLPPTGASHAGMSADRMARGFIGAMPAHIRRLVRRRIEEALSRPDFLEDEDEEGAGPGSGRFEVLLRTRNGRLPVAPLTLFFTQHMMQEVLAAGLHYEPWALAAAAYNQAETILDPVPPPLTSFES